MWEKQKNGERGDTSSSGRKAAEAAAGSPPGAKWPEWWDPQPRAEEGGARDGRAQRRPGVGLGEPGRGGGFWREICSLRAGEAGGRGGPPKKAQGGRDCAGFQAAERHP